MIEKDLSFVIDDDLFNATKQGDIEKVKRALESGVSPNALFRTGKTLGLGQQERLRLLNIAAKVFYLFLFFSKIDFDSHNFFEKNIKSGLRMANSN